MAQPKILVFLHDFEPGGVEVSALRLARSWQDQGARTKVIVGQSAGALSERDDLPLHETLKPPLLLGRYFKTIWMIAQLPAIVRRHRPDIVFCPGNTYSIVAVVLRLLLRRQCPKIVVKVSNDLRRRDMHPLLRFAYGIWLWLQGLCLDIFVGLSDGAREEIEHNLRIAPERVRIMYDAAIPSRQVDDLHALRRRQYEPARGTRYLTVGRLAPQKNLRALIDAFASIAGPDDRLEILGEGSCRGALERQIRALGLDDQVRLPGFCNPATALATADVFVLPSLYEGVPAALVEALAAGIPIVATNCSTGIADLLDGGRLGLIVDACDPGTLARAMLRAAREITNHEASRRQAQLYSVETAAARYLQLFRAIHAGDEVSAERPSNAPLSPARAPAGADGARWRPEAAKLVTHLEGQ
ncbi:glycosyltransferase [Sphingomonas nostoxanthinifaciens]|uniref:glycosyltransferase n=1 Tax=Sphingomonas nostoxanthinifaciens TaxID=2872652 RepID=UPI001CC1FB2F|nr:glycosyltransferase [Sphingomonas nostoxanthinifaciens]UAK25779.1 glycosyltransferase [Sphingomonas nostoxanthinifaciens]